MVDRQFGEPPLSSPVLAYPFRVPVNVGYLAVLLRQLNGQRADVLQQMEDLRDLAAMAVRASGFSTTTCDLSGWCWATSGEGKTLKHVHQIIFKFHTDLHTHIHEHTRKSYTKKF